MTLSRRIDKRDYFIRALNAGCYRHKAWVIEAFSFVEKLSGEGKPYPYALHRREKGAYFFIDPDDGNETFIEGTFKEGGPFHFLEEIMVGSDEVPNIHQNTITFYGNLLVNYCCLIYAFGDKVDFMAGPMTVAKMEGVIEKRLEDTPAPGKERDAAKLYIDEYKKFNDGIRHLEGFTQLCVPSASIKTMTVSPEVIKRRNELFKEHAHELNDPLVQAKIDRELIAMEKAWIKGDPAERFYIKSKSFDIVRKKQFLMLGQDNGFGITGTLNKSSLSEGWDIKHFPEMNNSLRNGSYSRGFLTALGGVEAKGNYRIFQNTTVAEHDCGTKLGLRMFLAKDMAKYFISSYVIEKDGSVTELTDANIEKYTDKHVVIRTIAYCKTPNQNVCAICVGSKIAQTPTAISTYASDLGSGFVQAFLAATHGVALKTSKVNFIESLR
jgi:hypothetical protein